MKAVVSMVFLFASIQTLASDLGIICRDDQRIQGGSSTEVVLVPGEGGYFLQSQFIPSLHSPDINIEVLAQGLSCRIDGMLGYCEGESGVVKVTERREYYYDSLDLDGKKKSNKYVDISVVDSNGEGKNISFSSEHCRISGG